MKKFKYNFLEDYFEITDHPDRIKDPMDRRYQPFLHWKLNKCKLCGLEFETQNRTGQPQELREQLKEHLAYGHKSDKSEHKHKFSTMGSFCGMFSGLIYWECEKCGEKQVNLEEPLPEDKTFSLEEVRTILNFYNKKNR